MNWLYDPGLRSLPWLAASAALAAALVALALGYARWRNVIDEPGRRRSHSVPTPRGGGIGIVLAVLFGLYVLAASGLAVLPLRFMLAIVLVALIGWIDDHRPLGAPLRLAVQLLAIAIWLWPVAAAAFSGDGHGNVVIAFGALGVAALLVLLVAWSVNLHNFMDGIDGLLAFQALFVLGALGLLCRRESGSHALELGLWAAAVAGFVPFNFPRARIFMGDVGSGVLGLLIAAAVLWQMALPQTAAASGLIAVSAFLTDASLTLLSRMTSGRRWYSAHREHLYQWLTRCGFSHARVVALYMGWNLLVVAPVLWWINRLPAQTQLAELDPGYAWAGGVYLVAIVVWVGGKRWCRRHAARRPLAPSDNGAQHASA